MKLSTLIELIGSGWILLVAGASLMGLGIAYGLNEALHLPLWACLIGLGLFMAIVGFAFVDRGNVEAEQQVKRIPLIMNVLHSPWLKVGASIIGGIFLARLTRVRRDVIIEKTTVAQPAQAGPVAPAEAAQPSEDAGKKGFSLSHYFGDQLQNLGSLASGAAFSLGMDALGIPSVQQLLDELLSGPKPEENPNSNGAGRTNENDSQPQNGFNRSPVSSRPRSENGSNYFEEFDPIP